MAHLRIRPIILTRFDVTTGDGTFQQINPDGLPEPCFLLRIINNSDQDAEVGFGSDTAHDFIFNNTLVGSSIELRVPESTLPNQRLAFQRGLIIYVNPPSGTGEILLAGYTYY